MVRFFLRRSCVFLLTLFVASLAIFAMVEIIPGDPARTMLGLNASDEAVAALRTELNLNQSGIRRYLTWIGGILQGDFGLSYTYRTPAITLIAERLAITLPLALYALILTIGIALPLGAFAGTREGTATDRLITLASQFGIALPNFWFAVMLILIFALNLGWLPAGGFDGWDAGMAQGLIHLTLPAIALALPQASILLRVMRGALIETARQDYIRTARAKGLSRDQALWRHGFANALIPVLTILGMQLSFLIAGAIIIENVFRLPGLGRLIVQAINQRDLILAEAIILLMVALVISVSFLTDLLYGAIDPRLRRPRP